MTLQEKGLRALKYSVSNVYLASRFRKEFPDNTMIQVYDALEANLIDEITMKKISLIAPTCYEINGKLFLEGGTKGSYDFVGDAMSDSSATEIYDMTTEMESGVSYTFYVSDTSYFKIANAEQTAKVMEFLDNLK